MKYQLTRGELRKLSFYMTMQMYKKIRMWLVTAIIAYIMPGIFYGNGGIVEWLCWYAALLIFYFLLFFFLNIGFNRKATTEVEIILENGRVRCVTEEETYGTSFKAKEISRINSFWGMLILTRNISLGEGKKRVSMANVYQVIPERVFESKEAREAFLAKLKEQAEMPTDPEESAGGRDPLFVFQLNTTEEALAKLRLLNHKYLMSKKRSYRFWLKAGMFSVGFMLMQFSWLLVRIYFIITDKSLDYMDFQAGEFLFRMLGVALGMIFLTLKPTMKGFLRRVRKSKKEQANIGKGEIRIFENMWVAHKGEFESSVSWSQFDGITEFDDCYLFRGKNKNPLLMMEKDGEETEKLQAFIAYCRERGCNYDVYVEPEKWSVGKKIFTVIICMLIFLVIGVAGIAGASIERTEMEEEEEFVFNPEEYEDYLPLEQQLEVVEQLGFTVSQESLEYFQEWMEGEYGAYGRMYVEGYPYYELLMELGYPKYDEDTWKVIEYSKQAYWMDFEGWDISRDYIDILNGIMAMSDGELLFDEIEENCENVDWEEGTGTIEVTFKCNGNSYEFEADVMNDWIDADFIGYMNEVLNKEGYTKNIYACYDGGQGNILFYRDEAWAKEFVGLTGIQLGLEAQ